MDRKKISAIIACICIIACTQAQEIFATAKSNADSAEAVIARFMTLMNYEALPHDSILLIESTIVTRNAPHDTCKMRRWYGYPHNVRIEVWMHDTLYEGYHNNGIKYYRKYDYKQKMWIDASDIHYNDMTQAYDYRGPLYNRHNKGYEISYAGEYTFNNHKIYRISVSSPETYDRMYLFEKTSGLLFLCTESTTIQGKNSKDIGDNHIDWRAYEEYLPLHESLIMSSESYQHHNTVTFARHIPRLIPMNKNIFKYD